MAYFSAGVEYGLHCLLFLVGNDEKHLPSARDLAELQKLSTTYIAKLFANLEKAGLVRAVEGINGGYQLARPAAQITVLEVVDAIEGDDRLFNCRQVREKCVLFDDDVPLWATGGVCSIHQVMLEAERKMREELKAHTLADIAERTAVKVPPSFASDISAWLRQRTENRRTLQRKKTNKENQNEDFTR